MKIKKRTLFVAFIVKKLLFVALFLIFSNNSNADNIKVIDDAKANLKDNSQITTCNPCGFSNIIEKLSPAVVNISTEYKAKISNNRSNVFPGLPEEFRDFFERLNPLFEGEPQVERDMRSLGSGFIVDSSGVIITSNHVITNAEEIKVTLSNGEQYVAKVLGKDARSDVAVLKIDVKEKLPYVQFASSDNAKVGDWVIAIGNPFGLGGSVSAGIISARGRDISVSNTSDFIQTDAAINSGNSGGPLFDMNGKVIGINTAIYSTSGGNIGIGFAIPSDTVEPIIESLIKGETIKRGWIGVRIQEITKDIKDSIGDVKGVLVAGVDDNSPASKAGMKVGDIVTQINGVEIDNIKKLVKIISSTKVGNEISLKITRSDIKKNQELTLKVKVEQLKEEITSENSNNLEIVGLNISNITDSLRKQYNIKDDVEGVMINDAQKTKNPLLRRGDVIIGVDNRYKVKNIIDFESAVKAAKKNKQKSILLLIYRDGQTIFTGVKVE